MQSHLQKLPPMAANLRRDDDDTTTRDDERRRQTTRDDERRRQTTTRCRPCKHMSNPHTPNYKREPFAIREQEQGMRLLQNTTRIVWGPIFLAKTVAEAFAAHFPLESSWNAAPWCFPCFRALEWAVRDGIQCFLPSRPPHCRLPSPATPCGA